MTADSAPELLVLHAVRLVGFADTDVLARRFGLDPDETGSILLDAEAYGWVQHTEFAGAGGTTGTGFSTVSTSR